MNYRFQRLLQSGALLAVMAVINAGIAAAQRIDVNVVHGRSDVRIRDYKQADRVITWNGTSPLTDLTANPGDSVCITVNGAHPVFYAYSLQAIVDTVRESIPALAPIALVLAGQGSKAASPLSFATRSDLTGALGDFYEQFSKLSNELTVAQDSVRLSDWPEYGIALAKRAVARIPPTPSDDAPDQWFKKHKDPEDLLVLPALHSHAKTLIATRQSLKTTYAQNVPEQVSKCSVVGTGRTTVKLRVKKANDAAGRFVSDDAFTVVVTPRYQRGTLEFVPGILMAHFKGLPSYSVSNGVISVDSSTSNSVTRPTGLAVMNVLQWGDLAAGPALGFGISADGKLSLSDRVIGVLASYKDLLRIGVGFGWSSVPTRLKAPAVVGAALPDGTKLDDLIERTERTAWYMLVALPGLKVKTPF